MLLHNVKDTKIYRSNAEVTNNKKKKKENIK